MPPDVLEMLTLVPAVKVASEYPVPLPIRSCPLVGIVVNPVPPLVTGNAEPKLTVIKDGFINHCIHGMLGLPVIESKNSAYGILILELGIAVAISYRRQMLSDLHL